MYTRRAIASILNECRHAFNTDVPQWTRHSLLYTPRPRCLLRAESREVGQEAEHRVSETQQVRMPIVRARPSVSTPRSPRTILNRRETYLGEGSEYGHVVFKASEERPLHAIDGDGAHMCSPFVEPRGDQSSSCGVTFAEQCRHHGIGERLCVRFGEVERRTRQGGAGKAMVLNEGNGKFQELSSAILGVENIG